MNYEVAFILSIRFLQQEQESLFDMLSKTTSSVYINANIPKKNREIYNHGKTISLFYKSKKALCVEKYQTLLYCHLQIIQLSQIISSAWRCCFGSIKINFTFITIQWKQLFWTISQGAFSKLTKNCLIFTEEICTIYPQNEGKTHFHIQNLLIDFIDWTPRFSA